MNFIKSLFIFISPAWLVLVVIQGLRMSENQIGWLVKSGVILSAIPLLLFLGYIMVFRKLARTTVHLLPVSAPSLLGYCLVLFVFIRTANMQLIDAMLYSMSSFLITLLYIYWYSDNKRIISQGLKKGQRLPGFSVTNIEGQTVSSKDFYGKKALIFFFRGNWCPLCMAQIDEVAEQYRAFETNNINCIFISPQPEQNTQKLAHKHKVNLQFFTDKNNQAATKLGLVHRFGLPMGFQALGYDSHSVYPTIIAIDEEAKILYCDQTNNYRVRPEPQKLMALFS